MGKCFCCGGLLCLIRSCYFLIHSVQLDGDGIIINDTLVTKQFLPKRLLTIALDFVNNLSFATFLVFSLKPCNVYRICVLEVGIVLLSYHFQELKVRGKGWC
jgi:hypothetical protein